MEFDVIKGRKSGFGINPQDINYCPQNIGCPGDGCNENTRCGCDIDTLCDIDKCAGYGCRYSCGGGDWGCVDIQSIG